ncbi:MAG: HRDC domain-containing protein [Microbacteriaceae bacterium]
MTEFHVLSGADEVQAAADLIRGGDGPIAVDAERASGYRYSQRAYLVQVFRRGSGTFLFDPPAIDDLSPIADALGGEEWIFHAASQDLPCLREIGLGPEQIFDTELASRILGRERVGLGAVVHEVLGIELEKAHSAADWSTRPLPQPWLEYAALDVELLVDLRERLGEQLEADGKAEIARQEFAAVLGKAVKARDAEPWRRLSGLHSVKDPRRLAIARELWLARDAFAQEIDMSAGRIVPDGALVAIAQAMPTSRGSMVGTPGFNGRFSRSEAERWWQAVELGRHSDEVPSVRAPSDGSLPQPRNWAARNPAADLRLKHAKEAVVELATVMHMPVENLLTPETLRRLCWSPPSEDPIEIGQALADLGARPWQIDAVAESIAEAFVEARQQSNGAEPNS